MIPTENLPPTLSVATAGKYLGMSTSAAYRAVARGELPTIRLSGRKRVPTLLLLRLIGYDSTEAAVNGPKGDAK